MPSSRVWLVVSGVFLWAVLAFINAKALAANAVANSASTATTHQTIKVEWYRPAIAESLSNDRARVFIRGKTMPGNHIAIGAEAYSFKSQTNYSKLSAKDLNATPAKVDADKNGNFQIEMTLPYTAVQISMIVSNNISQSRTIILLLHVAKNRVQVNVKTAAWNLWHVYIGPTFKLFNIDQSNSIGSQKISSTLLGSTVDGQYNFRKNYFATASITSVQGVGSLPTTGDITFSDFELALGVSRNFSTKWWKALNKSINLSDISASSPFLIRNSSSAYVFETATVNKLALTFTGSFEGNRFFDSAVSFGLAYGLLNSSQFSSSPGEIDGILDYQVTHQLASQFYLLGDLTEEYDAYSFSSYDLPSSASITTSLGQFITTVTAAIAYKF